MATEEQINSIRFVVQRSIKLQMILVSTEIEQRQEFDDLHNAEIASIQIDAISDLLQEMKFLQLEKFGTTN
jgi:hypothetical protein